MVACSASAANLLPSAAINRARLDRDNHDNVAWLHRT
jgi:hypothetical protein